MRHLSLGLSNAPRLERLRFDGLDGNWQMFRNDFVTQVNAMDMLEVLLDSRLANVHQVSEHQMASQGPNSTDIIVFKTVWATLVNSINNKVTIQLVCSCQGPAKG